MQLIIFSDNDGCARSIRGNCVQPVVGGASASMPRTSVGVEGISRQRQCAWCINCADGCAKTVLAHYHKAGASNLIGETFSTQETGVIEIWEV